MSLHDLLQRVVERFRADNPAAPTHPLIFGFVVQEGGSVSIHFDRHSARLIDGIHDAQYLVCGSDAQFASLCDPETPGRAALVGHLRMRPDYPFNNYLLSIFLNTFDLAIPDLDYTPRRFDGPFPFPPPYPAAESRFPMRQYTPQPLPTYNRQQLPALILDDHPTWVALYDRAWQLAFRNLRQPEPASGFIANFIDPAFNATPICGTAAS